jgi:flagellar motility protein MotE (MotC chaperone)
MKITPQFRVLPFLIIVAMLAFSVRLVDFSIGLSSLSGGAMAKDAPKEEARPPAMPDEEKLKSAGDAPDSQIHTDKDGDEPEHGSAQAEKSENWRDAADDEFEYSTITREVFDDLGNRRRALDKREKEIMAREAILKAAEQEIERKFQELSNLRIEIEALLQQQSEEELARIQSLVKIYEGMKPKEAARIFDTLDLDVLVTVMSRMSERRLSPILANMNPERARTITIMLAEEKQLPGLPGP